MKRKKGNAKKGAVIVSLLLVLVMILSLAIPKLTRAAAGGTPPHTKLLTDNHDGTYTLSLDVVGESERKPNPVNVTVILDHSGSMGNRTGGYGSQTRMAAAQSAVNNLARSLFNYNTTEFPELVEMALVGFSTTGAVTQQPTTSYNTFSASVNGLNADGGTNWEDALQDAAGINYGDEDPTYVIFVSDGNPTFRNTRGNYNPMDNYYYNTYGVYGNGSDSQTVGGITAATTIARCYDHAVDDARSLATAVGADHFYTIGAYGNVDRMQSLITDVGAPAGNYFSAANTTDLQNALSTILAQIEKAGIGSVEIEDGTTNQVKASTGVVVELLEVDTSSFKYYKDGVEWTDAPPAEFVNGAVEWDLSSVGVLDDGVKYTVTFDCYPSQYTYDIIAQLKNGDITYEELDPEIQKYIVDNGNGTYSLRTNTNATLDWDDTRTEEDEDAVSYTNPDPVRTDSATMSVSKAWENELDARAVNSIEMTVLMDDGEFHKVTLSYPEWTAEDIFISPGIIKNGQVLPGAEGHDFTFAELGSEQYNWELVSPVVHPMLIDGTLTMLTLVDENHPAPTGAATYIINGKTYYSNGTSAASLDAYNYRRSNLNLTKVVTGEDAPEDATFPFNLTVNNSKAENGSADDTNSDYYVWFSIYDTKAGATVMDANVTGATGPSDSGYYYAPSGTAITVDMKDGWNLRFTNLPSGTTYTFAEGDLADGFAFNKAELTSGKDSTFKGGKTSTGTVENTNTSYVVTYTNDYQLTDLEITKVWDDAKNQDGIRLTAEELKAKLTLSPEVEGKEPTIVDNGDGTYTITYTGLPRFSNGEEVEYTVTESEIDGYTTTGSPAKDHGTITNTHEPEVTEVTVVKVWDDDDNIGGIRPTSINVQLTADGVASGDPVTLPEDGEWTYTWENLPKYNNGTEISYTADETAVPAGYTKTGPVKEVAEDGTVTFTITNTYTPTPVTVSFPVKKVLEVPENLEGPAEWSYTIDVEANDDAPEAETMTGTVDQDNLVITFGDFEFTAPGTYTYTVTETGEIAGVTNDAAATTGKTVTIEVDDDGTGKLVIKSVSSTTENPLTFTNTYAVEPATASFPVKKVLEVPEDLEGPAEWSYTIDVEAKDGAPEAETMTGTVDQDNLVITFGDFEFTAPGTYTYTVTETGEIAGVTNDAAAATGKTVTVEVGDDGTGKLVIKSVSSTTENPLTFTNTYSAEPTTLQLGASKTLEAQSYSKAPDVTGQYTLILKDAGGKEIQKVKNPDGNGTAVMFDALSFDKPGIYIYTVTEEGSVDGVTNGITEYTVTVTVTDDGEGHLVATITSGDQITNFVNTYSAKPVKYDPPVHKDYVVPDDLIGANIEDSFTFTIEGTSGPEGVEIPMPEHTTIRNSSTFLREGETDIYEFGDITFTVPGTYVYTVKESGSVPGVTNDEAASTGKTITVVVTDNGTGQLVAEVTPDETAVTFTNTYGVEPITAAPEANKSLKNRNLNGEAFTFVLKDETGKEIESKTTDSNGNVKFSDLTFTAPGVYKYTITETAGDNKNITYSSEVINVTITVTDDTDGTMTAVITYDPENNIITNTYTPDPTEAVISVNKVLTGRDLNGGEFSFTLTEVDENGNPLSVKKDEKSEEATTPEEATTEEGTTEEVTTETTVEEGTTTETTEGETAEETTTEEATTEGTTTEEEITTEGETVEETTTEEATTEEVTTKEETTTEEETKAEIVEPVKEKEPIVEEPTTDAITDPEEKEASGIIGWFKSIFGKVADAAEVVTEAVTEALTESKEEEAVAEPAVEAANESAEATAEEEEPTDPTDPTEPIAEGDEGETEAALVLHATNDAAGLVNFDAITYDAVGTHYYKITEDSGSLGGVTYDESAIIVKVEVTYSEETGLYTATVIYPEDKTFENTYVPEPVKAAPEVTKTLEGRALNEGEFTFQLIDEEGNVVAEATNGADGTVTFAEQTYDQVGEYKYTIVEVDGGLGGVTYDEGVVEVTVIVTDDLNGHLVAELIYSGKKEFINTYEPAPVSAVIETKKTLEGRDLEDGEFSFSLLDEDGQLVENVKNAADGTVTFSALTFEEVGTYKYTISETVGSLGGVTYDTQVIDVTITVTDDLNGNLVASVSYSQTEGFVNTYDADGEFTPSVTKTLTGKDLADGQFTFELYDADGTLLQTKTNDASGKVEFDAIAYELADAGKTFTYTIKEVNDEQKFVTYDEHTETLTVTVEDNGDGTLNVTGTYSAGGSFTNVYQPPKYAIEVEKKTVSKPKEGKAYYEGETIEYEIVVTNTGEGTLTNVVVEDPLTGDTWTIETLEPGESKTFTTKYVVTAADVKAGKVLNEVTAKGETEDPDNPTVEDDANVEDPTGQKPLEPKTGDESHLLIWTIMMLSSLCGLVGMMIVANERSRKVRR
ncbi:MAG: Cna B-type domain-containing protein [Lachnospiraceae bacterium]|nr:Cna B-type domain-containing protein [Lachnospiraceae bacterium]